MTVQVSFKESIKSKIIDTVDFISKISHNPFNAKIISKSNRSIKISELQGNMTFVTKSDINYYVRFTTISSGGTQAYPIGIAVIGVNLRIL